MLVTLSLRFYQIFTMTTRGRHEWFVGTKISKSSTEYRLDRNFLGTDGYRVRTKFEFMPTPDNDAHAVLIYSRDNDKFKIKDSQGVKYEIPINRPDSVQVY